jgi:hypothetical protein
MEMAVVLNKRNTSFPKKYEKIAVDSSTSVEPKKPLKQIELQCSLKVQISQQVVENGIEPTVQRLTIFSIDSTYIDICTEKLDYK